MLWKSLLGSVKVEQVLDSSSVRVAIRGGPAWLASASGLFTSPNLGKTLLNLFPERRDCPVIRAHLRVNSDWRWTRSPLLEVFQDRPSGWRRGHVQGETEGPMQERGAPWDFSQRMEELTWPAGALRLWCVKHEAFLQERRPSPPHRWHRRS